MDGRYEVTYKDPEGKVLSGGHVYWMPITLFEQELKGLGHGCTAECYFPEWGMTLVFENINGKVVERK